MGKKKEPSALEQLNAIANGTYTKPAQTGSSSSASTPAKTTGGSAIDQLNAIAHGSLEEDKKKSSRKDKWDAFWEGIGKNVKAGATNSTVKNQQHYWAHNDPDAEKYVSRRFSGMNTDISTDRGLNESYVTERLFNELFDPNRMVGQERGQGSRMYTQEDADKAIARADEYWAKQQQREKEAQAATQNAFEVIDPDTKVGEIALSAANAVAYTAPSLAKDAALTAASAGTLAPALAAAGVGRMGVRLAAEMPTLTVRTVRYFDEAFQDALDAGASQEEAIRAASETALPNAIIESAGGLDALATKLVGQTGKTAARTALQAAGKTVGRQPLSAKVGRAMGSLGKVAFEEGTEEVAQGLVERGAAARNYDEDTLVWDLNQIANDFGGGAMGGLIMGAGMRLAGNSVQAVNKRTVAKELQAEAEAQGVPVTEAQVEQAAEHITRAVAKEESRGVVAKIKENIPQIEGMEPVSTLTGTEFSPQEGQRLSDQVLQFFNSIGNSVKRNGLGPVSLTKRGIKSDIMHGLGRAKAISFGAIPDVIQYGKQIDFVPNWENSGEDSFIFAAPIKVGNDTEYMGVVVLRGKDNHYYLHEVVDSNGNFIQIQEDSTPEHLKTKDYGQARVTGDSGVLFDNSIAQPDQNINPQNQPTNSEALFNSIFNPESTAENQAPIEQPMVIGESAGSASEGLASAEMAGFNVRTPEGRGREYTSDFRKNTVETMLEQHKVSQEMADDLESRFQRLPNDQLEEAAKDYIDEHEQDELLDYLQTKVTRGLNTLEQAIAMELYTQYQEEGNAQQAATALQIVQDSVHMAGQMVQSVQILAKAGPELLQEEAIRNAEQQRTNIHESRVEAVGVVGEAIAKAAKGEWDGTLDVSKITPAQEKSIYDLNFTPVTPEARKGFIDDTGLTAKQVKRLEARAKAIYEHSKETGTSAVQWLSYLALATQAEGVNMPLGGVSRTFATAAMLGQLKTLLSRSLSGNAIQFTAQEASDPLAIAISNGLRRLYSIGGQRAQGGGKALLRGAKQGLATARLAWMTGTLDMIGNKFNESQTADPNNLNRMGGPSEKMGWQVLRFISNCVHFSLTALDQPFRKGMAAQVADQYERGNAKAGVDLSGSWLDGKPKEWTTARGIVGRYGTKAGADFLIEAYDQKGTLAKEERMAASLLYQASDIMRDQGADAAAEFIVNNGQFDAVLNDEKQAEVDALVGKLEVLDNATRDRLETVARGRNISEVQQEQAEYQGSETTFQNDSTGYHIASGIRGLGRAILNWGNKTDNFAAQIAGRGIDTVLRTAQPFVQVFGNQLSAVLEYTPLGSAVGLAEWVTKGIGFKNGRVMTEKDVSSISNRIARGIVGGTLLGVGMLLRGRGILSGEEPEDEIEAEIWKQNGVIPNAFKIGDTYYDYSNIGPALVLLNIGAAVYDEMQKEGVDDKTTQDIIITIMGACGFYALEDVTGDQGWEGILELTEEIGEQDYKKMATGTIGSYLRQRYPQLLNQFAQFRDPYVRDMAADTEKGWTRNRFLAGVPGRSEELPAKRDVLGEEMERYPDASPLERAWHAFVDPAQRMSRDRSDSEVLNELSTLARATGEKSILLGNVPYTMSGYKLSGAERNAMQKTYNGGVAELVEELLGNSDYQALNAEEKLDVIKDAEMVLWYQARQELADGSKGAYTLPDEPEGSKMAKKMAEAEANAGIDMPTYLINELVMDQDYSLKYRQGDSIPITKSGVNKGKPKGDVGDVIPSGKKKGAAWAIKQQFGGDLTADQMYYLWTLESPSGDSAWTEVKNGNKDNDYYRFFKENWTEDELRNL